MTVSARPARRAEEPSFAPGRVELQTPAKLNLGLRLMGVRDDGYHLLESIFAPVELYDRLEIEITPGSPRVDLEVVAAPGAELPPGLSAVTSGPENLAARAAEAFCLEAGRSARVRIRLEKAIPAAAGMGGGSSDAAAVLRGLAGLIPDALDEAALERVALGLGADVPFFLTPQASLVEGIGEIVRPIDGLPPVDLVIANPGISLDTAQVYRATDALGGALTEPRPGSTMRAFSRLCHENGDPRDIISTVDRLESDVRGEARERWAELLINDLEPAARRLCPPVGRLLAALSETGAIGVGMTGSGATVFGVFESDERSNEAAEALRRSGISGSDSAWIEVSRLIGRG